MSQDKASATLQKQFETLQEQQAHKLARRKQRAEERGKTFVAPTSGHSTGRNQMSSAASTAFGVDDDLGLKVCTLSRLILKFRILLETYPQYAPWARNK